MPEGVYVCIENLDEGFGIAQSFIDHKAKDFDEFVNISKAATIDRKDIFELNSEFKGTFPKECQETSVPQSLLSLVRMIQLGPNIKDRSYSQYTLTIAQLLMYSFTKKLSNRHMKYPEPPDSVYLGIMIHCISLFKHISEDVQGVVKHLTNLEPMLKCQSKRVSLLPKSYSNPPPAELRLSEPDIQLVEGELSIICPHFNLH
ncbi:unnamed protein product [Mytilus edulis]|uniref:Uncharacterized protein n=1 Tax=Mytilus edulis TaxID=6550 RepID=A0A8S3RQ52_MYTED|nr:unnamed protein product [Mytilus edulis]